MADKNNLGIRAIFEGKRAVFIWLNKLFAKHPAGLVGFVLTGMVVLDSV